MEAEFFARKSLAQHASSIQNPPAEYQEMYGRRYFDCAPLRCLMSVEACGDSHRRGLNLPCLECPAGAKHVLMAPNSLYRARNQGSDIRGLRSSMPRACVRCGDQHIDRLMAESFCITCWNRALEVSRGSNGKGHWPKLAAAKLRKIEALVTATPAELTAFLAGKHASTRVLKWERISADSALLIGIAASREEVAKVLERILPRGKIVDFTERAIERPAG